MKLTVLVFTFLFFNISYAESCQDEYAALLKKYDRVLSKSDIISFQDNGKALLEKIFRERVKLHETLPKLSNECKIILKEVLVKNRMMADFIGAHYYQENQISADSIDYEKAPPPISARAFYHQYYLKDPKEKFEFKTGDILITKGISYISSTISEVMSPKSVFSHIVFLYKDPKTQKIFTMESYIGYGVKIFDIDEALKNENVRILVLRMKNQKLAEASATYMYNKIKKGPYIPYDYKLDFKDNSKMSCEEVAYDAFKTTSKGEVVIPENMSKVYLESDDFLKKIGLKKGLMMVPGDMESDSRFEIVLDWTDYRVIRDSWRKDAIMGEIFRFMNEAHYKIRDNYRSGAAKFVWSMRDIPGVWNLLSKLSGIPTDFNKDVPVIAISTIESIKSVGGVLLKMLSQKDEEFKKDNDRWMTSKELRDTLDVYIKSEPKELEKIFRP